MRTARIAALFVAIVILGGCTDTSSQRLTGPLSASADGAQFDKNEVPEGKVVQSVTGHAEFDVTTLAGEREEYSVTAERRQSGRVTGELELKQQRNGDQFKIHGTLVCVTTTGNMARLAARVDRSTHPDVRAGQYLAWSVIDNDAGHGGHHQDMSTEFFLFDEADARAHCVIGHNLSPFFPVKGQLKVRDESTD